MGKKISVLLMGLFVLVFSSVNLYFYFNKGKNSYNAISGMITGNELVGSLNVSLMAFILQWVILIIIVLFSYAKFVQKKKKDEVLEAEIPRVTTSGDLETEIDILYRLIKEKRRLTLTAITNAFNINKDKALEWARILEDHDLVMIEYPAFSDPEVEIKEPNPEKS